MSYENALSTLAEVAIAIAGFSGIVSVFGRRSAEKWSAADRSRLFALLIVSLTSLLFCLLPFVLLSIPVSESTCWRWLSLLMLMPVLLFDFNLVRIGSAALRMPTSEHDVSLILTGFFLVGDLFAIGALAANVFVLAAFWPYLSALIWGLTKAAMSFVRLLLVLVERESNANRTRDVAYHQGMISRLLVFLLGLGFVVALDGGNAALATPGAEEEWPQRFLWVDGTDHELIVLYEKGTAAYSARKKRPGHPDWHFAAFKAWWAWCEDREAASPDRCLHLYVNRDSADSRAGFRFDYRYEPSKLTEFGKMGIGKVLERLEDASR